MKYADWIIQSLRDKGIKKDFVVQGGASGDLMDAFTRVEGIEYVAMFHEQACSFAAEAYAKVTGGMGCVIVTSGPGGQNLLTGIANCYYDSTPVLFICGQVNSQFMGKGLVRQVGFQENDIVSQTESVTKLAIRAYDPFTLKDDFETACNETLRGRQGPIVIDIPVDVQKKDV